MARKTWTDYCNALDGIIFMVDAADHERLAECKEELEKLFNITELENVPFVILGNKIDKAVSLSECEMREVLDLPYH